MRKISVTRKKNFFGSILTYAFILDFLKTEEKRFPLKNGQTIEFEIDDEGHMLNCYTRTSSGETYSNVILIEAGTQDKNYVLVTKNDMMRGAILVISENN